MVCKNCGIANSDNSRFCSECGSALPRKKAEVPEAPAAEAVNAATVPPMPSPVPGVVPPMPSFAYIPPAFAGQASQTVPPAVPMYVPPMAQPVPEAPAAPPVQEPVRMPEPPVAPQVNPSPFGVPVQQAGAYAAMPPAQVPQSYPMLQPLFGQIPPYGQMPPYGYPSPLYKDPNASKVTWGLWLGITSAIIPFVTCSFGAPVSVVLAIVALCLGIVCVSRVFPQNKSKAIAAIVTGSIGLGVSILGISVLLKAAGSLQDSGFMKDFEEYFNSFIAFMLAKILKFAMIAMKAVINQVQIMLRFLFLK